VVGVVFWGAGGGGFFFFSLWVVGGSKLSSLFPLRGNGALNFLVA